MLNVCQSADKSLVVQNETAKFEFRFWGLKDINSLAEIIVKINKMSLDDLEALHTIIKHELPSKREEG